jgi:hypothetical protein
MLIKIQSVDKGATSDRTYARDILGRPFFPQVKTMELKAGQYAFAVEALQTKTMNPDTGLLEDLAEPRKILQITATFPDKASAVEAAAEAGTLQAEVQAEVIKSAVALKLTDKQIAALADAAF